MVFPKLVRLSRKVRCTDTLVLFEDPGGPSKDKCSLRTIRNGWHCHTIFTLHPQVAKQQPIGEGPGRTFYVHVSKHSTESSTNILTYLASASGRDPQEPLSGKRRIL